MKPKTMQIINGIFWSLVTLGLDAGVIYEWTNNAVPVKSLILGLAFFTAMPIAVGLILHLQIKEANQ